MDKSEMNIIINERNARLNKLNKFLYSMNLIGGSGRNLFNQFAEKLLQQLEGEADYEKIKNIVESELVVTYGLYLDEFDSGQITTDIFDWWERN